ncbi:MetQ/NlpA family ABC transporter substrate-binding protein [Helcococcus ovis]
MFSIIIAARKDNRDSEKIKVLKDVMNGEKIKKFIEEKLKGHAKAAF